jgi:uncharacterized membrane protein YqhA
VLEGSNLTIATLTLVGIILIGVGLGLQGWFILDLNKRITHVNSVILVKLQNLEDRLEGILVGGKKNDDN